MSKHKTLFDILFILTLVFSPSLAVAEELYCETLADELLMMHDLGTFSEPKEIKNEIPESLGGPGWVFRSRKHQLKEGVYVYPRKKGKSSMELAYKDEKNKVHKIVFDLDKKCKLSAIRGKYGPKEQALFIPKGACEVAQERWSQGNREPASLFPLEALSLKNRQKQEATKWKAEWGKLKRAGVKASPHAHREVLELCAAFGELFPKARVEKKIQDVSGVGSGM